MNFKRITFIISLSFLIINTSCKKEFTTVGNGLIDNPDFVGKIYDQAQITIYDQKIDSVFATNLPVHGFGVYKNDAFGLLKGELATTLSPDLSKFTPDGFGNNTKILSAEIRIPYFSKKKFENGASTFVVDSVYGNQPMEIKLYELGYLLPSYDPNTNLEEKRKYYSNFDFTSHFQTQIADTIDFVPDFSPFVVYERDTDGTIKIDDNGELLVKDTLGPRFLMKIDTSFVRQKIFDQSGQDVLLSKSAFQDYFRGLYFQIIPNNNNGSFLMLDFSQAEIFISYTHDIINDNGTSNDTSDDFTEPKYEEMHIKFDMPKVNIYQNNPSIDMQNALAVSDPVNGDDQIFIKGDAGSEAIVKLFSNQEILAIKNENWLINNAELYFYVDTSIPGSDENLPENLLLYDNTHHKLLADIYDDENVALNNKIFGGNLQTDDDGNKFYKFSITKHLRNIIEKDSINVDLALRVTSAPLLYVKTPVFNDPDNYNPKGVVLFGNQSAAIATRPKLIIKYTKPE